MSTRILGTASLLALAATSGAITYATADTAVPSPPKHHHRASPQNPVKAKEVDHALSGAEVLAHYHVDEIHSPPPDPKNPKKRGWTGRGQHVALLNYDKVTPQQTLNVQGYFDLIGSRAHVNYIGDGSEDDTAPTELELDIEMVGLMAPDAIIDVYSFADAVPDDVAIGTALADTHVHIFSSSWSPCEKQVTDDDKTKVDAILEAAAKRGVTILYASGDDGLACETETRKVPNGASTRSWPTTSPFVTAVGATSFEPATDPRTDFDEVAWRYSGGGPSIRYGIPDYQRGVLPSDYDRKPVGARGIPDVAMVGGEPGILTFSKNDSDPAPKMYSGQGTSYASPLFAGLTALVNEARISDQHEPIGFLNPILYRMTDDERRIALPAIHEIDAGSRKDPKSSWNSLTGLGAPISDKLLDFLRTQP